MLKNEKSHFHRIHDSWFGMFIICYKIDLIIDGEVKDNTTIFGWDCAADIP